jgi:hypothetical protein
VINASTERSCASVNSGTPEFSNQMRNTLRRNETGTEAIAETANSPASLTGD